MIDDTEVRYSPELLKLASKEERYTLKEAVLVVSNLRAAPHRAFRGAVEYFVPRIALFLSILLFVLHIWWAVSSRCGVNFARGGALLVLVSAGGLGWMTWLDPKLTFLSGGPRNKFDWLHPLVMLPLIGVVGTIIWGYGDLLPFGKCKLE